MVQPTVELDDEFTAMVREWLEQEGTLAWEGALDDFSFFVRRLLDEASPEKVGPGWVPCTHYWPVNDDGRILGTSRLRHWLVSHLEREGGHIGYEVRPCERGKGMALSCRR